MEQDWKQIVGKYYSKEQLERLAARGAPTPEEQEDITAGWQKLKERVAKLAEAGADPASPEAQECAREWQERINAFTGGDPDIAQSLQRMWEDRKNWPVQPQPEVPGPVTNFIQKALAVLKEN